MDKQLQLREEIQEILAPGTFPEARDEATEAILALFERELQSESKWIAIAEDGKKPYSSQIVLAYYPYHLMPFMAVYERGMFRPHGYEPKGEPTHWQPLPKAPSPPTQ